MLRPTTPDSLLVPSACCCSPLSVLALACDDAPWPQEPLIPAQDAPPRDEPAALVGSPRWAAGYLLGQHHCKATSVFQTGAIVRCFARNGAPVDAQYTVMLSS